ncbi:MAG TPA: ATP-binding protein [Verrucomicrobiae bacterium]|nr:ATP-binding protein [Verrucomicrobiae bacterium]
MTNHPTLMVPATSSFSVRSDELFEEQKQSVIRHTDRLFFWLLICQWIASVFITLLLSPQAWEGRTSSIHVHVIASIVLGGLITSVPVFFAWKFPGQALTRHAVAIGQMLMAALLVHLTGGRIETHFHFFGSLAILAFYRDWRVLLSASAVVIIDHIARGLVWPESVFGVASASLWRSAEHGAWVAFEVAFLVISIRKSVSEMRIVAERQARLEELNNAIEAQVAHRTAQLTREIEERTQADSRLREQERQLRHTQQVARLGGWEWDLIRDSVTWSEEASKLYGQSPQDLGVTMEKCMQRVHPDDLGRCRAIMGEALRTGQPFVCDHRALLPDGTEHVIQGRGEVLRNETGQPIKMFGTVQDITETRRAEEALRQSEERLRQSQKMEAVGRLAGGVAHDFNNLLTVITGYCGMMLHKLHPSHPLRKNAEEISRAAERASALTHQLLAFSRKQVLQTRVLDLNEIVKGMEKMLRRLIGEDVELQTRYQGDLWAVKADPGQLEQVIMNMVVNGRDAMPRGGELVITTENVTFEKAMHFRNRALEAGDYVLFCIRDSGVGMTDEVKSHLFEPFYTTKGVGKGTGLGLATCFGIVSQSGGDIHVTSEPNVGTTFKVYLPRTLEAMESNSKNGHSPFLPKGAETVVVVEDDPTVREFTASVLRECGYAVQEAGTAVEALPLISANRTPDLVVTDVIMPQMSGKELYNQLREQEIKTRVLFISGYTDDALSDLGVLDGDLSFLSKPFTPAKLAQKVRDVLDTAVAPAA